MSKNREGPDQIVELDRYGGNLSCFYEDRGIMRDRVKGSVLE